MTTNAEAIRGREHTQPQWETVKKWAKATLTKQRMAEALLLVCTLTVLGTVLLCLHRALDNYIIVGF